MRTSRESTNVERNVYYAQFFYLMPPPLQLSVKILTCPPPLPKLFRILGVKNKMFISFLPILKFAKLLSISAVSQTSYYYLYFFTATTIKLFGRLTFNNLLTKLLIEYKDLKANRYLFYYCESISIYFFKSCSGVKTLT